MGHTLRGALTAWLSLIALQAIVANGSGKVAAALTGVEHLVSRALDPAVPAIPDRSTGAGAGAGGTLPAPGRSKADAKAAAGTGSPYAPQYVPAPVGQNHPF